MFAKIPCERNNADAAGPLGSQRGRGLISRFGLGERGFGRLLPFCRMRVILDGVTRYD